ncbi:type II toxin-antitoxin system Phd/YefM family antitoxin [Myceligenerans xiligouense]|uniref:Antitoxin n=1 Tax=Myceligenerans xiligouense TaxID=253184 RepID=A0A3N4YWL8_9MICO|nr:type II toxin-antitoxin system prevent-host-death family antitoxin [Myceligenerans xiligouense]RPF23060.1 prevent-host-death family protein [Myceligenerans xiligouense]
MTVVNVQEAKTHLSRLIARAQHGDEVTIARAGKPMVRLTPVEPVAERTFGTVPINLPDDFFFEPLDEDELSAWE